MLNLETYNKLTKEWETFGEVQVPFNISLTIDGTNDSGKVEILNYESKALLPYTFVKFYNMNWIISKDRVERYANESGYLYKHIIQLEGFVEVLNARDLTNCGFNQNVYSVEQIIRRLFKLSNCEYPLGTINSASLDITGIVDYIKTFENYTLLTALREFLSDFNCSVKLSFNSDDEEYELTIVSKTGTEDTPINDTFFNVVKELKNIGKNSYGTRVVSNAENVVSTSVKVFPSIGGVKPIGAYTIKGDNAYIKLPSPVFKVNRLKMTKESCIYNADYTLIIARYNPLIESSIQSALDKIRVWLNDETAQASFDSQRESVAQAMRTDSVVDLFNRENYDPVEKVFRDDYPNYTFTKTVGVQVGIQSKLYLGNEVIKNGVEVANSVFAWERGKDRIGPLTFFEEWNWKQTSLAPSESTLNLLKMPNWFQFGDNVANRIWIDGTADQGFFFPLRDVYFQVEYIPMSDIKIEYDNENDGVDTKLYNQNGRLTDSVAFSKSLNSYAKEITSDNITRYANVCAGENAFETIPNVGRKVIINNETYVINNISLDTYQNEIVRMTPTRTKQTYYYDLEYTLSKKIAIKSLLVEPNTNVRDYGIPQNYNVKRRQVYKDFYELSHSVDENADTQWYLSMSKIINLTNEHVDYKSHTAMIKLSYKTAIGGGGTDSDGNPINPSTNWYYQVESTTYLLKKAIYEVFDFDDNNIIGYSSQNVWSGFDIKRVLTGGIDSVCTPISYVDDDGEFFGIEMSLVNSENINGLYDWYVGWVNEWYETNDGYKFLSTYHCFIPTGLYVTSLAYSDFIIRDGEYNKDALEVPVFEYSCQLDNSDDVDIGENIFEYDNVEDSDSFFYIYSIVLANKNTIDENNALTIAPKPRIIINQQSLDEEYIRIDDTATFVVDNDKIELHPRLYTRYNIQTDVLSNGTNITIPTTFKNKDIAIFRHKINKDYETYVEEGTTYVKCKTDLMFIIRNNENITTGINYIPLYVNHYKLN